MCGDRWHVRGVALPGGGEPLDWWIADGWLSSQPVDGAAELPGGWIAPGLVDAHAHLTFEARDRLGLERGSDALVAAHGSLALEVAALAGHGVPATAALAAATTGARRYLGLKGLVDGAAADLVTYERDPREDLSVLLTPAAIVCDGVVLSATTVGRRS